MKLNNQKEEQIVFDKLSQAAHKGAEAIIDTTAKAVSSVNWYALGKKHGQRRQSAAAYRLERDYTRQYNAMNGTPKTPIIKRFATATALVTLGAVGKCTYDEAQNSNNTGFTGDTPFPHHYSIPPSDNLDSAPWHDHDTPHALPPMDKDLKELPRTWRDEGIISNTPEFEV